MVGIRVDHFSDNNKISSQATGTNKPQVQNIYFFANGQSDGNASMAGLLGSKGANLAEMNRIGLPIPPGFTISTTVCSSYFEQGRIFPVSFIQELEAAIERLEALTHKSFGESQSPLFVSVCNQTYLTD